MNKKRSPVKQITASLSYVPVVVWVIFTFILIGWVFFASLSDSSEIFSEHVFKLKNGFRFGNYVKAWNIQMVSVFFMNSLLYTVVSCIGVIIIASPAAYVLSRYKFTGNTIIQTLFAAALGIPVIMVIMPLFGLASAFRITCSRWLLMFLYTAMNVPFAVFFLLAFFKNLSFTYEEAAAIDGCSPVKTFWKIMLPLVQPGLVTLTVFNFITVWNEFFVSLVFADRPNVQPVTVGLYNIIQSMRHTEDLAGIFASVVIVFLPALILYIFFSDKIIKGVTAGAIKL